MKIFNRLKVFYKAINGLSTINDISIDLKIRTNQLLLDARTSNTLLTSDHIDSNVELIVSFTTYNKRIHDVHLVIESIAQQALKPNRLILWLDENEFTLESIPLILHKQIERGLEVRFCPNYKSYKKLIPTLQLFPDANIITIDDDILYPHDMIEILMREHQKFPYYIIGHRGHKIKFKSDKHMSPYSNWDNEIKKESIGHDIFLTGVGGILYPPNSLNNLVLNCQTFMDLCANADDVWFKAMALLNDVKCKKVNDERVFFNRFLLLADSQDIALYKTNIVDNDIQLKEVFDYYDLHKKFI